MIKSFQYEHVLSRFVRRKQQTAHLPSGAAGSPPPPWAAQGHRETAGYSQRLVWTQTGNVQRLGTCDYLRITYLLILWHDQSGCRSVFPEPAAETERARNQPRPFTAGAKQNPDFQPPWENHGCRSRVWSIYASTLLSTGKHSLRIWMQITHALFGNSI